jgi:hypothetical protein
VVSGPNLTDAVTALFRNQHECCVLRICCKSDKLADVNASTAKVATSDRYLKLALPCKVLAIISSVVVPLWIFHPRWGLNPIADGQLVGLAVLSLIPNRWLVFTRFTFAVFLLLSLFPFRVFLHLYAYKGFGTISAVGMIVGFLFFAPLPLSLVLSRIRFLRGDKITFA